MSRNMITVPSETPRKCYLYLKEKISSSNKKATIVISGGCFIVVCLIVVVVTFVTCNSAVTAEKEGLFVIPSGNIKFNPNQKSTYEEEISSLNQFLMDYYNNATKADDTEVIACPSGVEPNATQVCILPKEILGHECNPENVWNYNTTSPCIILSYNGKTNTKFDPYDDITELPSQMPHRLRDKIKDITYTNNNTMQEVIWVSCTLLGIHSYYGPGFPKSFFSNTNLTGYRKPIVALQLNLKNEINTTVEITCNMWAKDIDNEKNPETSVKFNVTVEKH
ncbi:sodium/potassium-transporting ATPase subunit beta-like [Homarus americanus]|uniref:sodium/potassium-transporting ATPase subunit beta-like n=1 Tax=Homarus americanus TaxID=6706 RepID=UPI001C491200|nr:sodium/potassium-transporting ATPase subunit beta-like [Homarus americanus]XP_042220647.1 sodium/potassium-transporting ATPase subunit beta-like [Homarus americanus]XP_042221080.1 sodium/potassium-transporting ATPase subunit beta-like [Homarus americanus]